MRRTVVVGMGYVGLPLAVQAAEKGDIVTGIDINKNLVELVNQRKSPYINDSRFENAIGAIPAHHLIATTEYESIGEADVIIICVPTPTDNNAPDLSLVTNATAQIARYMKRGQLLILESTVNPGVTRDEVLPIIENLSKLKVGVDFFLAHCPERIDPGNKIYYVGNLNRVVGGITKECTERAKTFYESIIDADILPLDSTEEAEFVKSWENSHRNVMIALANSAALICDSLDMDINNVLAGLQSKVDQFGLRIARPGIGPGGHCIPEDIHYVIKKARQNNIDTNFLNSAADLNDRMPKYAVHQLKYMITSNGESISNLNVALLGLSYKEDIDDYRRSPAIEVGYLLNRFANKLYIFDPFVNTEQQSPVRGARNSSSLEEALQKSQAIFIGTGHTHFKELLSVELLSKHNIRYVLDGRNILDPAHFRGSGIMYRGIGRK